jgi:acyl-coenzyme A thioesterase PaaI-like protein
MKSRDNSPDLPGWSGPAILGCNGKGTDMPDYGPDEMKALLAEVFAPWIQDLSITPVNLGSNGATFRLPQSERLVRGGGDGPKVVCGQAVAAVADTASVLTLSGLNGRFRNCTTVDLTTHFLRPMMLGDVDIVIEALSNGRRMAVTRAEFRAAGSDKLAATANVAFAYLED